MSDRAIDPPGLQIVLPQDIRGDTDVAIRVQRKPCVPEALPVMGEIHLHVPDVDRSMSTAEQPD
jgi:hypothetical protein